MLQPRQRNHGEHHGWRPTDVGHNLPGSRLSLHFCCSSMHKCMPAAWHDCAAPIPARHTALLPGPSSTAPHQTTHQSDGILHEVVCHVGILLADHVNVACSRRGRRDTHVRSRLGTEAIPVHCVHQNFKRDGRQARGKLCPQLCSSKMPGHKQRRRDAAARICSALPASQHHAGHAHIHCCPARPTLHDDGRC